MDYSIFKSKLGSAASKAAEIATAIRNGIASGALPPGQLLAGATAIGKTFSCSGKPVEAARNKLMKEGLVVRRDGHYFVSGNASSPSEPHAPEAHPAGPITTEEKLDAAFADLMNDAKGAS